MATFTKLRSKSWRVQVRRKGRYISETFLRRDDARRWATDAERQVDRGEAPIPSRIARVSTFGDLIDLHLADMQDMGKAPGRSKDATLAMLKRELGTRHMSDLGREQLIKFGRRRAAQGAGPVTLGIDIGTIKLVLSHAAAVHGLPSPVEPVDLARIALKRLGLVGKGNERDRRPTQDELDTLIAHFDGNLRQVAPVGRIIKFAVATAMRQEEICRATWSDLNTRTKMLTIRDRKDPRQKRGDDQRIPLLATSGYDAMASDAASRDRADRAAIETGQRGLRTMAGRNEDIEVTIGSGNVFADLGVAEPEEELAKAQLASHIRAAIKRRELTQVQAAYLIGADQPKVSALINGRLTGFSSDRLLRCLTALGQDVDIVVKAPPKSRARGRLRVVKAA